MTWLDSDIENFKLDLFYTAIFTFPLLFVSTCLALTGVFVVKMLISATGIIHL